MTGMDTKRPTKGEAEYVRRQCDCTLDHSVNNRVARNNFRNLLNASETRNERQIEFGWKTL